MSRPPTTVFLDRDGTLNVKAPEGEYIGSAGALALLPGAASAVATLNRHAIRTVLISNQRGVARGMMTEQDVVATNTRLEELLATEGAHLDAIYFCPHETGECGCRKPQPGLILQAVGDHPDIDLSNAALIGDADSDVALGESLGLITIRLGLSRDHDAPETVAAADLAAAVTLLLGTAGRAP